MILDQETAKLGYPGEISRSLNADHHGVCKFYSPEDVNYKVVLSALKSLVSSYIGEGVLFTLFSKSAFPMNDPLAAQARNALPTCPKSTRKLIIVDSQSPGSELDSVRALLSIPESMDHDLNLFLNRRADSTCTWVLERSEIRSWLATNSVSELQWMYGRPGRGKSVLSSFLVEYLREEGAAVQHFFFRSGDETKRSISALLRSLAYQVATQIPSYRRLVRRLAEGGLKLKESDWRGTWKKLFTETLFQMDFMPTLYWVIDGLDESGSPQHIFDMLADIDNSKSPIKCLVTSRWNPALLAAHERVRSKICSSALSIDEDSTDIRIYTEEQLNYLNWRATIKQDIMGKVLQNANGNFLWVYLVLEEIKDCHTESDLEKRFEELPPGMENLYRRMEDTICQIRRTSDKDLSRHLLLWAIYTRRAISVDELGSLLEPEHGQLLDISHTIDRLCGHFVVVEGGQRIALLHQSAREYLMTTSTLPFSLDGATAHCELFEKCIGAFMGKSLRARITPETLLLLEYRATSWPHHLQSIRHIGDSDKLLDILVQFFTQSHVLVWIQALATMNQLKVLIESSHALTSYINRRRRLDAARNPTMRRFEDLELLESWTQDLLKIPGKFGGNLSRDPSCIFTSVPPFCPTTSAIHKMFAKAASSSVTVRGQPVEWDDCLASVSVGSSHLACLVAVSGRHLAVANEAGTINLWDCTTFQQVHKLHHSEKVSAMCFDTSGSRLASYGSHTTKLWAPQAGQLIHRFDNLPDMVALCLNFTDNDNGLLMGSDRRCLLKCEIKAKNQLTWTPTDPSILNDDDSMSPSVLAISPNGSMIAAAYRRFPLIIWSIDPPKVIKRISRKRPQDRIATPLPFADKLSWHPSCEELMGIFLDGYTFKYNVLDGTMQEQPPDPGRMPADLQCSPDGGIYAIRGVGGSVKLFDYQTSTLIYQISSAVGMSTAFSFSQDGRRFFQLRGNQCTVWEPNSLIRLHAADDHAVNSQSSPDESYEQSNIVSESFLEEHGPISVVSPSPTGTLICTGNEDGLIELFDSAAGSRVEIERTATGMSIEHLVWNTDGSRFMYTEISGRLTLIELSFDRGWKHRRVKRFKPKMQAGGIRQILFSPDTKSALVVFRGSAQLWSLESGSLQHTYSGNVPSALWTNHPRSLGHLLSISPMHVSIHQWVDLTTTTSHSYAQCTKVRRQKAIDVKSPSPAGSIEQHFSDDVHEEIEQVRISHLPGYVLVIVSRRSATGLLRSRFEVLNTTEFDSVAIKTDHVVDTLDIPPEIAAEVEIPLNILPNGRLVFVDQSLRLCTWHLNSSGSVEDIARHFFIPRNWLPDRSMDLLCIGPVGTLFCPLGDGLAIIDSMIASEW